MDDCRVNDMSVDGVYGVCECVSVRVWGGLGFGFSFCTLHFPIILSNNYFNYY